MMLRKLTLLSLVIMAILPHASMASDNMRRALDQCKQTERWRETTSNPDKIVEQPFRQAIKDDFKEAAVNTFRMSLFASTISFAALKMNDVITSPAWNRAQNLDLAKIALGLGGLIGIASGYNHLKHRYQLYQEFSPIGRTKWAQKELSKNDETPIMSIDNPTWVSDYRTFSGPFVNTNKPEELQGICSRSGLIWATLNQIRSKSNEVKKLQTTALKDFYLANSLLSNSNPFEIKFSQIYAPFSFPDNIRSKAINSAIYKHVKIARRIGNEGNTPELITSITHKEAKRYWKQIRSQDQ